jgi:hypothetical protein
MEGPSMTDHSEVIRLCSQGRLFEVQAWIDADGPFQWRPGVDPEEE